MGTEAASQRGFYFTMCGMLVVCLSLPYLMFSYLHSLWHPCILWAWRKQKAQLVRDKGETYQRCRTSLREFSAQHGVEFVLCSITKVTAAETYI